MELTFARPSSPISCPCRCPAADLTYCTSCIMFCLDSALQSGGNRTGPVVAKHQNIKSVSRPSTLWFPDHSIFSADATHLVQPRLVSRMRDPKVQVSSTFHLYPGRDSFEWCQSHVEGPPQVLPVLMKPIHCCAFEWPLPRLGRGYRMYRHQ